MDYDTTAHRVTVRESEDKPLVTPEEAMGWPERVAIAAVAVMALICAATQIVWCCK